MFRRLATTSFSLEWEISIRGTPKWFSIKFIVSIQQYSHSCNRFLEMPRFPGSKFQPVCGCPASRGSKPGCACRGVYMDGLAISSLLMYWTVHSLPHYTSPAWNKLSTEHSESWGGRYCLYSCVSGTFGREALLFHTAHRRSALAEDGVIV
jgi:hypothetical protein